MALQRAMTQHSPVSFTGPSTPTCSSCCCCCCVGAVAGAAVGLTILGIKALTIKDEVYTPEASLPPRTRAAWITAAAMHVGIIAIALLYYVSQMFAYSTLDPLAQIDYLGELADLSLQGDRLFYTLLALVAANLALLPFSFAVATAVRSRRPFWPALVFTFAFLPIAATGEFILGAMGISNEDLDMLYPLIAFAVFAVSIVLATLLSKALRRQPHVTFTPVAPTQPMAPAPYRPW